MPSQPSYCCNGTPSRCPRLAVLHQHGTPAAVHPPLGAAAGEGAANRRRCRRHCPTKVPFGLCSRAALTAGATAATAADACPHRGCPGPPCCRCRAASASCSFLSSAMKSFWSCGGELTSWLVGLLIGLMGQPARRPGGPSSTPSPWQAGTAWGKRQQWLGSKCTRAQLHTLWCGPLKPRHRRPHSQPPPRGPASSVEAPTTAPAYLRGRLLGL